MRLHSESKSRLVDSISRPYPGSIAPQRGREPESPRHCVPMGHRGSAPGPGVRREGVIGREGVSCEMGKLGETHGVRARGQKGTASEH